MTQHPRTARRWSYSTGERGVNRVRIFQHATTGRLMIEWYEPGESGERPRPKRAALGQCERDRAKAIAEELAANLRAHEPTTVDRSVTLATLFDIYIREVTPTKGEQKQSHDRLCVRLFLDAFGDRPAASLSRREWDRFIRDRRSGLLRPGSKRIRRPVRDRIVGYDLRFLLSVLNWATMSSNGSGSVLLERNPLKGLPVPREESPRRPLLDDVDYRRLLSVSTRVDRLFRVALVLARETGHRIGAIRQIRWSDVDLSRRTIRWRGENDKIGFEHTTPITPIAIAALEAERLARPAIADAWIFADASGDVMPRNRFYCWWRLGTALAELPVVSHRGWHSLRRSFATDLKTIPLKDLCQLGGWKCAATVLTCYQQADETTMRTALEEREARRISR